jgi:hypothetical protein
LTARTCVGETLSDAARLRPARRYERRRDQMPRSVTCITLPPRMHLHHQAVGGDLVDGLIVTKTGSRSKLPNREGDSCVVAPNLSANA